MKAQLEAYVAKLEQEGRIPPGGGSALIAEITRELKIFDRCPYALGLINFIMRAGVDWDTSHAAAMMATIIGFIEVREGNPCSGSGYDPTLL